MATSGQMFNKIHPVVFLGRYKISLKQEKNRSKTKQEMRLEGVSWVTGNSTPCKKEASWNGR